MQAEGLDSLPTTVLVAGLPEARRGVGVSLVR